MARTWSQFQSAVGSIDPEAMARISRFLLESTAFGGRIGGVAQLRQRFGLIVSRRRSPLPAPPEALAVA